LQAGDHALAAACFRASAELCANDVERAHLLAQLAALATARQE
jgi:hypothetical protein